MFKRIKSLSSIYPVIAFNESNNIFIITNQHKTSLGFGFISEPLSGVDESISDRLEVLLNQDFPTNTTIQFSLIANPDIKDLTNDNDLTAISLRDDSLLANIIKNKNNFFKSSTSTPIKNLPNIIRNYELIISITLPAKNIKVTEDEIVQASNLCDMLSEVLKTAGFYIKHLSNSEFLKKLSPFFNSNDDAVWRSSNIVCDKDKPIANQLLDFDNSVSVFDNHLEIGGYYVNCFSCKRLPDYVFFGQAIRYSADVLTGTRGVHVPFIFTATIYFSDSSKLRGSITSKRQWVINQAYGPLVKFLPKLGVKKHGFDIIYEQIENGQKPLRINLTLLTFCKNESDAKKVSSVIRTFYKENGFEIMPDKYFNLPIFLNALPFGTDFKSFNSLMRFKTLTAKHVIPLLPIFAESKGTGTSVLNLISRSGQLMRTSIFDSPTNYNLCIAAQSGSGKSFLVNEIIVSFLAQGATCYVIDVGRSYQKLCNFLNGNFLSFGMDSNVSLNPFDCIRDYNEEADMLIGLIGAMIAPTQKLSDYQTSQLKRIIGQLFNEHKNSLSLDILSKTMLENEDSRVKDMGAQLYTFTSKGEYGRFFSNKNTLKFDERFTVLELEELKGRKQLQQVVLLQLVYQIQQNMYLGKRDRPKLIIIDEAWDLLREGDIAKFIETGYRRFRKYGGAAITVTQSINDLYASEIGCAIAENSANMYLLGQKNETISALKRLSRLPLTDSEYELLKSVHTVSGVYSEIFLITQYGNAIGRLIVDPFRQLLYSTKPDEINAIDEFISSGLSLEEAINKLIKLKNLT